MIDSVVGSPAHFAVRDTAMAAQLGSLATDRSRSGPFGLRRLRTLGPLGHPPLVFHRDGVFGGVDEVACAHTIGRVAVEPVVADRFQLPGGGPVRRDEMLVAVGGDVRGDRSSGRGGHGHPRRGTGGKRLEGKRCRERGEGG